MADYVHRVPFVRTTDVRAARRNRTPFGVVLGLALLGGSHIVCAQLPSAVPRVGVLSPQNSTEAATLQRIPFEQGLRELGWTPGRDVIIEYRYAEGDLRKLADLAAELVGLRVNVIVARSPPAIRAAQQATAAIPIIMAAGTDPVREGFVKSLGRPGGNISGLAVFVDDLGAKQLELLKTAVPKLRRVAVLVNPTMSAEQDRPFLAQLNAVARGLKADVAVIEVDRPKNIETAFATIAQGRFDALLVRADPLVLEPHAAEVVRLASAQHLPAMYPWRLYVDAGGLMSYATGLSAFHRRSATYVDKILRGARPESLPIEQPLIYELVINLKTAKALGLEVPSLLLLQANEVIR